MPILKLVLALALAAGSLVCSIIILVEMFRDAVWKGIVGLLCGLYFLYYAVFEFDHDSKWLIVIVSLLGGGAAGAMLRV
jgi:hypothetical protein